MSAALPGGSSGKSLTQGVIKAALRLLGGPDLADAMADLTGLTRKKVHQLRSTAVGQLTDRSADEYRNLGQADRDAAETLLTRVFSEAADESSSAERADLPTAALMGAEVFANHLLDKATPSMIGWSEDGRSYFRALLVAVATLTVEWYYTDPNARAYATAAGVSKSLAEQREQSRILSDLQKKVDAFISTNELDQRSMVELINVDGGLPTVLELDPYRLGSTVTIYGDAGTYGRNDPYVSRTCNDVDKRVQAALTTGQMVLIVGPSKSGKTRTAFEGLRRALPDFQLLCPVPSDLSHLIAHPRLAATSDPTVLWLDDLQRFLSTDPPLTSHLLDRFFTRSGPSVVLATLRSEERARLRANPEELARETRLLLSHPAVVNIELSRTSDDPAEQTAAYAAYPRIDIAAEGLAEQLAGAPDLLQQYRDARYDNPTLHAVVQTAIDWTRVGMTRPIHYDELILLANKQLILDRPEMEFTERELSEAVKTARTPPVGAGRVATLRSERVGEDRWGFRPFDYLIDADDGEGGPARGISDEFWFECLSRADLTEAFVLSNTARQRGNMRVAVRATQQSAAQGHVGAIYNLGLLLSTEFDPPQTQLALEYFERAAGSGHPNAMYVLATRMLAGSRDQLNMHRAWSWLERAANAGHVDAMAYLGYLSFELEPPQPEAARIWLERAARAGNATAMFNLGLLLSEDRPQPLPEISKWFEGAARVGHIDAMVNLGCYLRDKDQPDMPAAQTWLERAAAAGHPLGMYHLGLCLIESADAVERSNAHRWLEQAAVAGITEALPLIGNFVRRDRPIPKLDQAYSWWEATAAAGHLDGMYHLGNLLANRLDPLQPDSARRWWEKASDAGQIDAMYDLGILLVEKSQPPQLEQGERWLRRAASAGNAKAISYLGQSLRED